ncbi:TonB-dependent receptor [Sphingomonas sp. KC8]|uniref:TonB-dependent receptor n=1 Tax=Sphingomonas sp. KC8 TaxID=1030157 RepID=UPI0002488A03|nr:TonB-dependent receptor [Sphingomonas sp. KC8]ARS28271.1 TonB-dependent receptor [Sphingomonas sp. KC8]
MSIYTKRMIRVALLAGSALTAFASSGAMAQENARQGASEDNGLSEIVVTAQRREERSQDVPITITALSPDGLRERDVTNLQGLQSQVPSLTIQPNGQASRDVMSPSIRGQGASFQGSPGVVVYMNEVPLPIAYTLSQQGGAGNFTDLQSVQVLSGAQGTLFGRNTTGGAILLTAARPTDRLEGHLSGGFGNYNMTEFEAVLNAPLTDNLRVRLVGASRDRDGFTKDINWNKDRDNQHWRMARIGIEFEPFEGVSNYTMAYYGYSKNNGTGIVPISFNYSRLLGFTMAGFGNFCGTQASPDANCTDLRKLISDQEDRGIRKVAHGVDDFAKVETWGVSNTTDVDLTEGLKLKNIISFASLKSGYASDQDGSIANINNTGVTTLSRASSKDYYELFTEELQIQGNLLDDKLIYTVGGFYSKQKPGGQMGDYFTTLCGRPGEAGALQCAGFRGSAVTNESKALFAQATLDFGALTPALDRVRLTGGYRYTWDQIDGRTTSYSPAIYSGAGVDNVRCLFDGVSVPRGNANNLTTDATRGCRYEGHLKSSAPNWTIGLDYRPIDNLLVYGKVTRGYKAGGFNAFAVNAQYAQFGPEFVTDWEAGFKSDFKVASRPVRLNVNAYNMDYSKIQRGLADFNPTTNSSGAATLSEASARIRGVEVEAMFKPIDELEIGGNYSYIDAHYKSFKYKSATPVWDCNSTAANGYLRTTTPDLTCIPLQYMSPHIFSVYGRLALPTPEAFGEVNLFVSYAWTDARHQSGPALEKFVDGSKTWEPGSDLAAYGMLSASIDWRNALGSGLDATLFGTNLLNKEYALSNSGVYNAIGNQTQIFGEPRMYGIRLRYNFGI